MGKMSINSEWEMNEDIVISGIAGRFSEADNIDELAKNLFDHVDMITEDERRWPLGLYGLPTRAGKIKDLSKFDAQFFGVHGKQANLMDPQARILLELTYEAICDAGINPYSLRGSRTGVYIGACVSEVEEGLAQDVSKVSGYALTGCSRSMFANRISYTFDFQGPSYAMDTACSSSFIAFQQAILGLRSGQCDQAIVGGVNICLRPVTALQFHKLNMLSMDGKCKFLDESADGYVRADACSVIFLQKKSNCKRIYGTVIHVKTNTDGYKDEGITYPSTKAQQSLMQEVLEEAQVDPLSIEYIEAHGTGTKVGDPNEVNAIVNVYCKNRDKPLLIGSVKSNLGHTEPASGLCSLAKVLITFENRCIPANLHFNIPNPNIKPLIDGTIKPVIENTPFNGGIIAINSFGFGGVNVHTLIKSHDKSFDSKSFSIYDNMPRLVVMCGRTESSLNHIFDFFANNPKRISREFLALINELSKIPSTSGMNYHGFTILKEVTDNEANYREVTRVPERRPLWFVFSGMGSQWCAMARALMPIPIFASAIHECIEIVKPFGVDLYHLLMEEDEKALDNIVAPFVTIAAVQIALVDIFRSLNIVPDGIIGHSVGELGCAYADGCFDRKQMMLSAYWRGKCVDRYSYHQRGLMAAVGLGWQECEKRCPAGIVAACHNSEDSTTISGPYEKVKNFVAQLKSENIFAREVKSCDIAFHSPYIGPIGPDLEKELKPLLTPPVLRSKKWISSSVPEDKWEQDSAKYSAPTYYVNNLVSPVLFQEALKYVPKDAVLVEFAPHALLQAILKRAIGADIVYLGLMKRNNNAENMNYLLQSIGKLYNLGFNPEIENLYPKVDFPVPCGTQSIGSLITWDHSQNWLVTQYPEYFNPSSSSDYVIKVDLNEVDDQYLSGHCIDGRILYPVTGYLMLGWKMLAKIKGQFYDKIPIEFENIIVSRATVIPKNGQVKFVIRMMETSGEFSISEGGSIVATGKAILPEESVMKMSHIIDEMHSKQDEDINVLTTKDIYKELRVRGYDYGESFQNLLLASEDGRKGFIKYRGQWVSFADNLLQMSILSKSTRALHLPVRIQSVRIDPKIISKMAEENNNKFKAAFDPRINVIATHGIEIRGLKTNIAPRRQIVQEPILEKYLFIPHNEENMLSANEKSELDQYIQSCCTLAQRISSSTGTTKDLMNGYKDATDDIINDYLNGSESEYSLIHSLNKIYQSDGLKSRDKLNELIKTLGQDELEKDIINNIYTRERFLRPLIDIVVENSESSLKIAEINETKSLVDVKVKNYLGITNVKFDYRIACSNPLPNNENSILYKFGDKLPNDLANVDLLIYRDPINSTLLPSNIIKTISEILKENGFAILLVRENLTAPEMFVYSSFDEKRSKQFTEEFNGLSIICKKSDSLGSMALLLRKIATKNTSTQTIIQVNSSSTTNYEWINELQKKLKFQENKSPNENIWLVDANRESGIIGFVNCLRHEPGRSHIRCLLNQTSENIKNFKGPYEKIFSDDLVINVINDKGQLGSYRHISIEQENKQYKETENAYLNVVTKGDLSSLRWFESEHKYHHQLLSISNTTEELYKVFYAPLNFRDIMLATGKLPPDALPGDIGLKDCVLGLEFAGLDSKNRRVMGITPARGLATSVVLNDPEFVWQIPDNWTMEEASTVPVVYSTAYYSLIVRGNLQPGESVLIHSGSGGVGQAAISICLSMGCQVFTTCGSKEKREFLKKQFPQLKDENIANSRNTSFEQQILRQTKGRGVDVVLNSLSEEKLHASIRCLAQHGRFLEIGKYDLSQNNPIGMSAFLKNIAFHGILLDSLFNNGTNSSPGLIAQRQMLSQLIKEGIKTGAVKPLKRTIFSLEEAEAAFRYMASGKHIGKVVLKLRDEKSTMPLRVKAVPRTVFQPIKSYIIIGGLGGLGLELAHWMVNRGAKNLVLVSRGGIKDGYQQMCIKRLRSMNVNVLICVNDPSSYEDAKKLIQQSQNLAPIGGIFNLAGTLSDGLFENQTIESFKSVSQSKVLTTINLDKLSRNIKDLEYFVCFSSISCGRGNAGQTNYGYANSVMERICESRKANNLPAIAIQWGAIGDVGMVAERLKADVVGRLSVQQRIPSCMAVMDQFLQLDNTISSSFILEKASTHQTTGSKGLLATISNIMGLKNSSAIHPSIALAELGLDSLMGVEVKQTLERDYDIILSLGEIRLLTINHIKQIESGESIKDDVGLEIITPVIAIAEDNVLKLNQVTDNKPVFFLPPIEGVFNLCLPLTKLLSRPVIGLNWTRECGKKKSIKELASYYLKLCRSIQPDGEIDLIGYSFGGIVALEISAIEKVNQLILLDVSPSYIKGTIEKYVQTRLKTNDAKERNCEEIIVFLSQFVSIDYAKTKSELMKIEDEKERSERAAQIYIENGGPACEAKDLTFASQSFLNKIEMMIDYEINVKSNNNGILLIRSDEKLIKQGPEISDDYELSKLTDSPVEVKICKGDHKSFILSNLKEIALIINDKL